MTSREDLGPGVDHDILPEEPVEFGDTTELPAGTPVHSASSETPGETLTDR